MTNVAFTAEDFAAHNIPARGEKGKFLSRADRIALLEARLAEIKAAEDAARATVQPTKKDGRGRPHKYPWLDLAVGEVFEIEGSSAAVPPALRNLADRKFAVNRIKGKFYGRRVA